MCTIYIPPRHRLMSQRVNSRITRVLIFPHRECRSGLRAARDFPKSGVFDQSLDLSPSACQWLPRPLTQLVAELKPTPAFKNEGLVAWEKGEVTRWSTCACALAGLTRPKIKSLKLLFWAKKSLQVVTLVWTNGSSLGPEAEPENRLHSLGRQEKDWWRSFAFFEVHQYSKT